MFEKMKRCKTLTKTYIISNIQLFKEKKGNEDAKKIVKAYNKYDKKAILAPLLIFLTLTASCKRKLKGS